MLQSIPHHVRLQQSAELRRFVTLTLSPSPEVVPVFPGQQDALNRVRYRHRVRRLPQRSLLRFRRGPLVGRPPLCSIRLQYRCEILLRICTSDPPPAAATQPPPPQTSCQAATAVLAPPAFQMSFAQHHTSPAAAQCPTSCSIWLQSSCQAAAALLAPPADQIQKIDRFGN